MSNQQTRNQQTRNLGAYNYRKLDVWQKAQEITAEVVHLVKSLHRDPAVDIVSRQLIASAGSVAANIAEGHRRFTFAAYKNHLSIAKGSACEADSWLDLLRRTGHITKEQKSELHLQFLAVVALLTKKIRALEAQGRRVEKGRTGEGGAFYYPEDSPLG